jgi:hypothetical protein
MGKTRESKEDGARGWGGQNSRGEGRLGGRRKGWLYPKDLDALCAAYNRAVNEVRFGTIKPQLANAICGLLNGHSANLRHTELRADRQADKHLLEELELMRRQIEEWAKILVSKGYIPPTATRLPKDYSQ